MSLLSSHRKLVMHLDHATNQSRPPVSAQRNRHSRSAIRADLLCRAKQPQNPRETVTLAVIALNTPKRKAAKKTWFHKIKTVTVIQTTKKNIKGKKDVRETTRVHMKLVCDVSEMCCFRPGVSKLF